jgi:hypothetical protein
MMRPVMIRHAFGQRDMPPMDATAKQRASHMSASSADLIAIAAELMESSRVALQASHLQIAAVIQGSASLRRCTQSTQFAPPE